LTINHVETLHSGFENLFQTLHKTEHLQIDLSNLHDVDSCGLQLFLLAQQHAKILDSAGKSQEAIRELTDCSSYMASLQSSFVK